VFLSYVILLSETSPQHELPLLQEFS